MSRRLVSLTHDHGIHNMIAEELGIRVKVQDFAAPALRMLREQTFPLILMDLDIAPGNTVVPPDAAQFERLMKPIVGQADYWRIGMYTIERLRAGGANRGTPIVVTTVHHPERCPFFPDAERRVLDAGANQYFDTNATFYDEIAKEIAPLLR